ncbi:MAG: hypothetical protein HXY34_06330 [Candidatus Thorarchaeota archaeon]|nr:hypothetical protein [Candidatus Thorarchaeota archaeon]
MLSVSINREWHRGRGINHLTRCSTSRTDLHFPLVEWEKEARRVNAWPHFVEAASVLPYMSVTRRARSLWSNLPVALLRAE